MHIQHAHQGISLTLFVKCLPHQLSCCPDPFCVAFWMKGKIMHQWRRDPAIPNSHSVQQYGKLKYLIVFSSFLFFFFIFFIYFPNSDRNVQNLGKNVYLNSMNIFISFFVFFSHSVMKTHLGKTLASLLLQEHVAGSGSSYFTLNHDRYFYTNCVFSFVFLLAQKPYRERLRHPRQSTTFSSNKNAT